jgi:hypothetical protein
MEKVDSLKAAAAFLAAALPGRLPILSGSRHFNSFWCDALEGDVGLARPGGRRESTKFEKYAKEAARKPLTISAKLRFSIHARYVTLELPSPIPSVSIPHFPKNIKTSAPVVIDPLGMA